MIGYRWFCYSDGELRMPYLASIDARQGFPTEKEAYLAYIELLTLEKKELEDRIKKAREKYETL